MGAKGLIAGLVLTTSVGALAAERHTEAPATVEENLKPLNWSVIATTIDSERSLTLHEWRKKYAADRNKKPPSFVTLKSLSTLRTLDLSGVDKCFAKPGEAKLTFGELLRRSIDVAANSRKIVTNSVIDAPKAYFMPSDRVAVGLRSHPFCVTEDPVKVPLEFAHSIDAKVQPDAALANDLNDYLLFGNHLLNQINNPTSAAAAENAMSEFKAYQGIMMSCLGYTESLGDTENELGSEIYSNLQRRSYVSRSQRPAGVSLGLDRPADYFIGDRSLREQVSYGLPSNLTVFKDDLGNPGYRYFAYTPELKTELEAAKADLKRVAILKRSFVQKRLAEYQAAKAAGMPKDELHKNFFATVSQTSWVSTGVYQFKFANLDTPKGDELSSNIGPCVDQWNSLYGNSCPISHTIAGYAEALTSPGQTFNLFCGVQKVLQSYNTQIHTLNPKKTSPQNMGPDGNLLPPEKRCVHPFWQGNLGYNHFGPFANSAPAGSIADLPSYPGNLKLLMECVHNNGKKVFGGR